MREPLSAVLHLPCYEPSILKKTKRFTAKPPGTRRGSGNRFFVACLYSRVPCVWRFPAFFICVITGKALGFYSSVIQQVTYYYSLQNVIRSSTFLLKQPLGLSASPHPRMTSWCLHPS